MKNPERVVELLAELRGLTETDFERHRLDVLEKDLATPPAIEVIDDTHQKFLGFTFSANGENHFRLNLNIHRVVWSYHHGEIPDGYQVHHIDTNKNNNDISNLQLLTPSEHRILHNKLQKTKRQEKICTICGKRFYSRTKATRCCSPQCGAKLAWQTKHHAK